MFRSPRSRDFAVIMSRSEHACHACPCISYYLFSVRKNEIEANVQLLAGSILFWAKIKDLFSQTVGEKKMSAKLAQIKITGSQVY